MHMQLNLILHTAILISLMKNMFIQVLCKYTFQLKNKKACFQSTFHILLKNRLILTTNRTKPLVALPLRKISILQVHFY